MEGDYKMAYKRVNWKNNPPSSTTPISAENLNIMDEGIEKAHQEIEELSEKFPKKMSQLEDDVGYAKSEDVGKVSEQTNAQFVQERHVSDKEYASGIIQTVGGTEIVVTDASSKPLHGLKLFGKTEQFSTTGKNLFKASEITTVLNENGEQRTGVYTEVKTSGTYSCIFGCDVCSVYVGVTDSLNSACTNICSLPHSNTYTGNVTLNEGQYIVVWGDGANISKYINIVKLFIALGSDIKDYEPYSGGFASPSPDWQQPLNSVGKDGQIESVISANLVSVKNAYGHYKDILTENNGDVIANGTDGEQTRFAYIELGKRELLGKKITYGFSKATAKNSMNVKIIIMFGNANVYVGSRIGVGIENTTLSAKETITLPNEFPSNTDRVIMLVYGHNSTDGADTVIYEKLFACIGEDGSYSPYAPTQTLITQTPNGLNGIPLGKTIPDVIKNSPIHMSGVYFDEKSQQYYIGNTKDFASGKYVQRIKTIVLNGTESEWHYSVYEGVPYLYLVGVGGLNHKQSLSFCTHAKWVGENSVTEMNENEFLTVSSLYFHATQGGITYTHASNWKAYLAEQYAKGTPVTVQYILTEPIVTELSDEEMQAFDATHSNYPNTTILNDCDAYMEVDYVADTKKYIDNKFAELAKQLV